MQIRAIVLLAMAIALTPAATSAGTWVPTPTTFNASAGNFAAGGHCGAWAAISGDHLLFFDVWSGTWTEVSLPEAHLLVRTLGAGKLMLVVYEDLAVAFHGPDQSVHTQQISGTLLDTGYSTPSFGCADDLAVIVTDEAFYVFDGGIGQWLTLAYDHPAGSAHFRGVVTMPDFVAAEIAPLAPETPINLAYSRRTGTFLETYDGIANLRTTFLLDHGFAGIGGYWPHYRALGWSAFTGELTEGVAVDDGALTCSGVERERRTLSHLMGFERNVGTGEYTGEFTMWVYDSLRGNWSSDSTVYDARYFTPYAYVDVGGRLLSHCFRDQEEITNSLRVFDGRSHQFATQAPDLYGYDVGRTMGGTVGAYRAQTVDDHWFWWCRSLEHPGGRTLTSVHEYSADQVAADQWFSVEMRTPGQSTMELFFYHGPTNNLTTITTWDGTGDPGAGTHVYCQTTVASDTDVIFYSGLLDLVARRTVPGAVYLFRRTSDHLAALYTSGTDFFFDARTGEISSRGVMYDANSLGAEVAVAYQSAVQTIHGYSSLLGTWTSQPLGGAGYGGAGGVVGYARVNSGARYWGFDGAEGTWAELVTTGSSPTQSVGGTTVLVRTSNRVWAFWPTGGPVAVGEDRAAPDRVTRAALARARCRPNPFNARALVEFTLPLPTRVQIDVFDLRGRHVVQLLDEERAAGPVIVTWETGEVASGVYLVRLQAAGAVATRKLVLVE